MNAQRYELLYQLGCAFAQRMEIDELLSLVLNECRQVLGAEGAAILLHDPATDELYFPYVAEAEAEVGARLSGLRFRADLGIAGHVLVSGEGVRIDDVAADPRFYGGIDRGTGIKTRSLVAAPLRARQGVIGVVQVVNRRGGPFTDEDLELLRSLSGSIGIAVENASLYGRLKESEGRLRTQLGTLRSDLARRDRFAEMVGSGQAMRDVFRLMESAARSPISVLVEGETGTGKELVARGIHRGSDRADESFLAVNCAAVSETLLESELFGHRRGSFTGAIEDRRGLFEAASGGTVFLDEVGDMPLAMQGKLLRVLQEGEVVPVGESRPRKVDVRVISATNRDLTDEIEQKRFREDLYYRLSAFPIRVPPLRDRREDIPLLVDRALAAAAERHHKRITGVEPAAMELLVAFDWPGNVRQLQNEIERGVALAREGEAIACAHLSPQIRNPASALATPPSAEAPSPPQPKPLRQARVEFEMAYIAAALRQHGGNVSRTAAVLGLSRVMLQRKMKEYGLRGDSGSRS